MLNTLAIFGSPRKGSNSKRIVEEILEGIKSVQGDVNIDKIFPAKEDINPCIACDGCHRNLGCVIEDDMQELYSKFDQADIVLVASPIYFNAVSAQLKGLIDRCQAIWASKYVHKDPIIDRDKKRLGVFVAAAGNPAGIAQFKPSQQIMELFFKSINTDYYRDILFTNSDENPIAERPETLEKAHQLGVKLGRDMIKER